MIEIIKAQNCHFNDIAAIEKKYFDTPISAKEIAFALNNPAFFCFAALENESLVGYIMMYNAADEGDITSIAVTESARNKGCGTLLIKKAVDTAEKNGVSILYLEVRESNIPARKLYEKSGFSITGERKNYYKNPIENAVLMAKHIKNDI